MFIDIHVHPAFFEPINTDPAKEEMRHNVLNIHKNGTAPLEHIFNQMHCAGLDRLTLLPQDYTSTVAVLSATKKSVSWWTQHRISSLALPEWIRWTQKPQISYRMPSPG